MTTKGLQNNLRDKNLEVFTDESKKESQRVKEKMTNISLKFYIICMSFGKTI